MNTASPNPPVNHRPYRRRALRAASLTVVALSAAIFILSCGQQAESPSGAAPTSSATDGKSEYHALVGRWQRTDSEYVIEVKSIAANGKAEAAYFNPRPINVARAEASREGGSVRLTVELRDAGYPGCIYKLTLDKAKDQLTGTYFQAAMNETYEITFVRLKE